MNKILGFASTIAITTMCVLTLTLCKKDANIVNKDATVINTGDPSHDGCGWWVKIDSTLYYRPQNLPASFQKNNLKVNISYILLNTKYNCGHADKATGPIEIDIKNITEKN